MQNATVGERRFRAFISYSTDPDYRLSQRVESFLENFHRQKLAATVALQPIQVCRDGSDFVAQRTRSTMPTDQTIRTLIEGYLDESEYLVLLCSAKACASSWVRSEIEWFLARRGADRILLVVTEGSDPTTNPGEILPQSILDAGLNRLPYYDLRGFRGRHAKTWAKVRDPDEELVNLAAHLHGETSGKILPLWHREALRKARRERLRLGALAVLFAAIAGLALWQRDVARDALAQSDARQLVLEAETSIQKDPELSLLLGLEAVKRAGQSSGTAADNIASLIQRAVLASPRFVVRNVGGIETFQLDPSGTWLAIGKQSGGVDIVPLFAIAPTRQAGDTVGSVVASRNIPDTNWVDAVAWSDDGQLLAVATRGYTVLVWDVAQGQVTRTLTFSHQPQSVSWRRGGHQLAVGLANGPSSTIEVYDPRSWRMLFSVPGMKGVWSPQGDMLASGHLTGVVALYDTTGALIARMPEQHSRYIHHIVWQPSGRLLATASVDDFVMVWDIAARRRLVTLPNAFALSATWSPDGRLLASGSGERMITVWDASTWKEAFSVQKSTTIAGDTVVASGASDYVTEIGFTKDAKYLIALDRSGSIRLYSARVFSAVSLSDWVDAARDHVGRTLTAEECRRFLRGGC